MHWFWIVLIIYFYLQWVSINRNPGPDFTAMAIPLSPEHLKKHYHTCAAKNRKIAAYLRRHKANPQRIAYHENQARLLEEMLEERLRLLKAS